MTTSVDPYNTPSAPDPEPLMSEQAVSPMFACLAWPGSCAGDDERGGAAVADPVATLLATAREFSPRVAVAGSRAVVCDVSGLGRLFGEPQAIAAELRRDAAGRGLVVRVAIAATRTAARLLAHARPGLTIVEPGREAAALADLPVRALDALLDVQAAAAAVTGVTPAARFYRTSPLEDLARQEIAALRRGRARLDQSAREARDRHEQQMETLARWGIRTLGQLAVLPRADLSARLGQAGLAWQRMALGDDDAPLVPLVDDDRFEAHLDLEWPIEGLEPLSFVLGRLLEPVCVHLERRGRAAAAITVTLRLVSRESHVRTLPLPAPMRDPKVLRTLALLDLESHPPGAGIDAVSVHVEPTPGRVLQHSLLERALPAPEQLSTLLARLTALMGDGRCGSPLVLDTHRPGAFAVQPFAVEQHARARAAARVGRERQAASVPAASESASDIPGRGAAAQPAGSPPAAFRRYRHPVPVRVALEGHRPARLVVDRPGLASGRIVVAAGPWRTSGDWWDDEPWHRDEWDIALEDGTIGRIFQDRDTKAWFMEGTVD
jgi:protein ImuB